MNVQDIARAVAVELGDGWTVQPGLWGNDRDAYLVGPDVRLHVCDSRHYQRRGRLEISAALTREQHDAHYSYSDGKIPEITVAPDKAARLIAGDIRRRLLPGTRELLDKLNERVHERRARERARDAQVKALRALIPGTTVREREPDEIHFGRFDDGGNLKVMYDNDVSFELRFPANKAAKLAEFLGKLQRGEA